MAEAIEKKIYYGPVYFLHGSEPYMTLAMVHARADAGVTIAEINLKFIWDVISQNEIDQDRQVYVADSGGHLIARRDVSLVLRNTDLSGLPQVQAMFAGKKSEQLHPAKDLRGREVFTAAVPVSPLGWTVFADLPIEEVYAPLYALDRTMGRVAQRRACACISGAPVSCPRMGIASNCSRADRIAS